MFLVLFTTTLLLDAMYNKFVKQWTKFKLQQNKRDFFQFYYESQS